MDKNTVIPPLPPGFVLDDGPEVQTQEAGIPPLPHGFILDEPEAEAIEPKVEDYSMELTDKAAPFRGPLGMASQTPPPLSTLPAPDIKPGPTIGPAAPGQEMLSLGEQAAELTKHLEKKAEPYQEYGKIGKVLDVPGQFLTEAVRSVASPLQIAKDFIKIRGNPMEIAGTMAIEDKMKGVMGAPPAPRSEAAQLAGGLGKLAGMTIPTVGAFSIGGRTAKFIFQHVPTTIPGKFIQDALKGALTVGLGMGLTEPTGAEDPKFVENKVREFVEGAETGAIFFGTSFIKFAKEFPNISKMIRGGITAAILDIKNGQSPLDERTLMQKAFDYGLVAYFTRHGQTPREYLADASFRLGLQREAEEFNKQAKADMKEEPSAPPIIDASRLLEQGKYFVGRQGEAGAVLDEVPDMVTPREDAGAIYHGVEGVPPTRPAQNKITVTPTPDGTGFVVNLGEPRPKAEPAAKPTWGARPQAKARTFSDPVMQSVYNLGGIKPDPKTYNSQQLRDLGLPPGLIRKDGLTLDLIGQALAGEYPELEYLRDPLGKTHEDAVVEVLRGRKGFRTDKQLEKRDAERVGEESEDIFVDQWEKGEIDLKALDASDKKMVADLKKRGRISDESFGQEEAGRQIPEEELEGRPIPEFGVEEEAQVSQGMAPGGPERPVEARSPLPPTPPQGVRERESLAERNPLRIPKEYMDMPEAELDIRIAEGSTVAKDAKKYRELLAEPTGEAPVKELSPEGKKWIDDNFVRIATEARVREDDLSDVYMDAVKNFKPGEDHLITRGPRAGEVVSGADRETALKQFIVNRKIEYPKEKLKLETREKEILEQAPIQEEAIEPELEGQAEVIAVLERNVGPKLKPVIKDLIAGKTVRQTEAETGISKSEVQRRRAKFRKIGKSVLEQVREDPETIEKATKRFDELEAKRKSGQQLSDKEARDIIASKAIKDGPEGLDLGFISTPIPEWAKKVMAKVTKSILGEAKPEEARERFKVPPGLRKETTRERTEDVVSGVKEAKRDFFKRAKEAIRIPVWSKNVAKEANYLVGMDSEVNRVTTHTGRYFKDYLTLVEQAPERAAKINEVLMKEDRDKLGPPRDTANRRLYEQQLAKEFGLNAKDVQAYRGVRQGIRFLQRYEMARHKSALREELDRWLDKEKGPVKDIANSFIKEGLENKVRQKEIIEQADKLKDKVSRSGLTDPVEKAVVHAGEYFKDLGQIDAHYRDNPGYIPHLRWGRYGIAIKGVKVKQGEVLFEPEKEPRGRTIDFEMFDHVSQAQRFADAYKVGDVVEFEDASGKPAKFKITSITDGKNPLDMQRLGVPEEGFMRAVNAFPIYERTLSRELPDKDIENIRKVLGEETLKFFAKGRFAKRKNIAGWSRDIPRSIQQFAESFPHAINRRYSIAGAEKLIEEMPESEKDYGRRLLEYWRGSKKDIMNREGPINQKARSLVYNWYLGFKPSFYFVNATQPLVMSYPYAQSLVGPKKAMLAFGRATNKGAKILADYLKAVKTDSSVQLIDITRKAPYLSIAEKRAIERMASGGEIGAARTKEIIGKTKFGGVANWFGSISEKQNRIHAALMGVEIAKMKGLGVQESIQSAREFTAKSQNVYNKANRMEIMRGALAPVTMFKSYLANYWSLQAHLLKTDKKAFATSMAIQLGMAGAAGLPMADTLQQVIPKVLRAAGIISDDEPFEKQMYDFQKSIDKSKVAKVLWYGLPVLAGISGHQALGAGGEVFNIAPYQMYQGFARTARGTLQPQGADIWERLARVSPTMAKHAIRFGQMVLGGKMATDEYGRVKLSDQDMKVFPKEFRGWAKKNKAELPKASDVSAWEKGLYLLGFPTESMRQYQEGVYMIKGVGKAVSKEKGGINREIGKIIGLNIDEKLRPRLNRMTPKVFENNFMSLLNRLPPKSKKEIKDIIKDAKAKGIKYNHASILTSLKEFIEE